MIMLNLNLTFYLVDGDIVSKLSVEAQYTAVNQGIERYPNTLTLIAGNQTIMAPTHEETKSNYKNRSQYFLPEL